MLVCYFRVSREGLISRGGHRKEREEYGGVPTCMVPLSRRQASLHVGVGGDEPGVFLYLTNQVQYQQRHDGQQRQK